MKGKHTFNRIQPSENGISENREALRETEQLSGGRQISYEHSKIAVWLKKVRFRKKLLGGVSERDVWKKFSELNGMYEAALTAERVRYDTMIEHYRKTCMSTENANTNPDISRKLYYKEGYTGQGEVW